METLRVGSLCYFDSFTGLIAGKVVGITGPSGMCSTAQRVDVQATPLLGTSKCKQMLSKCKHNPI